MLPTDCHSHYSDHLLVKVVDIVLSISYEHDTELLNIQQKLSVVCLPILHTAPLTVYIYLL